MHSKLKDMARKYHVTAALPNSNTGVEKTTCRSHQLQGRRMRSLCSGLFWFTM